MAEPFVKQGISAKSLNYRKLYRNYAEQYKNSKNQTISNTQITNVYNKPSDKELSKQPHINGQNDMFKKKLLPTRQMTEAFDMLAGVIVQNVTVIT